MPRDLALKNDTFSVQQASSRVEAVNGILDGAELVEHEHDVDMLVLSAAEQLLERQRQGRLNLDIEAFGSPDDVLSRVNDQMESIGVSYAVGEKLMNALQNYLISHGSDFSRTANAKPLYARITITTQKPQDLPNLELFQAGQINGRRKLGSEATRVERQMTIYGSTTTSTQGMNMPGLFTSKEPEIFYCFGVLGKDGLKGIDTKSQMSLNAVQALSGAVPVQSIREIQAEIKAGTLSAEAQTLIQNLAQLQQSNVPPQQQEQKIAVATDKIIQSLQTGRENNTLPTSLIAATVAIMTPIVDAQIAQATAKVSVTTISTPQAQNDGSKTSSEVTQPKSAAATTVATPDVQPSTTVEVKDNVVKISDAKPASTIVQPTTAEKIVPSADVKPNAGETIQVRNIADTANFKPAAPQAAQVETLLKAATANSNAPQITETRTPAQAIKNQAFAPETKPADTKPATVEIKGPVAQAAQTTAAVLPQAPTATQVDVKATPAALVATVAAKPAVANAAPKIDSKPVTIALAAAAFASASIPAATTSHSTIVSKNTMAEIKTTSAPLRANNLENNLTALAQPQNYKTESGQIQPKDAFSQRTETSAGSASPQSSSSPWFQPKYESVKALGEFNRPSSPFTSGFKESYSLAREMRIPDSFFPAPKAQSITSELTQNTPRATSSPIITSVTSTGGSFVTSNTGDNQTAPGNIDSKKASEIQHSVKANSNASGTEDRGPKSQNYALSVLQGAKAEANKFFEAIERLKAKIGGKCSTCFNKACSECGVGKTLVKETQKLVEQQSYAVKNYSI